jgi:hypothetical protein
VETYRQRKKCFLLGVDAGVTPTDVLGGAPEVEPDRMDGTITTINDRHLRIAYCECGAQLAGGSRQELFEAAQQHLAHHHPQLLGALELDVLMEMAEDVGGIDA